VLRLYKNTAVLAAKRAVKAWPVAFSLVLFAIVLVAGLVVARPLGILGGFLVGLLGAACVASYLHLVSLAVAGAPITFDEVKRGLQTLFWDVVSVMFALWVISFAAGIFIRGAGPQGDALAAMLSLAMAFFLNATPELIYQGRVRSFHLLLESGRFVMAHPVAWFLPNVLFAAIVLASAGSLRVAHPGEILLAFANVFSPSGIVGHFTQVPLWAIPLLLLLLHFAMVFRGVLFGELSSSNPRRRAWEAMHR
jgi:hypothetical protein